MSQPTAVAATFATVLLLLRDQPERREAQAGAFKAFLATLGGDPLDLQVSEDGLTVGGVPLPEGAPGASALLQQLRGHGVGTLRTAAGLSPAAMLSVARALANPVGRFVTLDELLEDIEPATRPLVQVFPPGEDTPATTRETSGFIAGEDLMGTLHQAMGLPSATSAPGVPLELGDKMRFAHLERMTAGRLDELLVALEKDPADELAPVRLNEIVAAADVAAREKDLAAVMRAAATLVRCEAQVPHGELRRAYGIGIRRMMGPAAVDYVARRVAVGGQRTEAVEILRRVGSEASEALLHLMVDSTQMEERRAYFNALRQVGTVSPLFHRLMGHEEWYVLRNVAELCGELRAEEMVPHLARHVGHADERVRRAVASALAKIGTAPALEPLRQLLRDPSPQVRLQAVQGLDGARSRGLAMPLAVALEEESNADVTRELLLALGRIGTPDAVQILARMAAPGRRLFNRRPVATRLTAVEALRLAGSAAAAAALQTLLGDDDREVRDAAQQALAQMQRR